MKNTLVSALICMIAGNVHAHNLMVIFQVYSSPMPTDTYHIYKRPESACMYGMDDASFSASRILYDVVFHYDARAFRHCGWHDSWQRFVVQRSDGAFAVLEWRNEVWHASQVTVMDDPHHLICKIIPTHGVCWPHVIIGDGIHCPPAHYSGTSCRGGGH